VPVAIPALANPLSSGEVVFSSLTLLMRFGPGVQACANMSGAFSAPIAEPLAAGPQNVWLFYPSGLAGGDGMKGPLPTLTQSQMHCP
jgi:hypothetical protein